MPPHVNWFEVLNAVSMAFPFLAWWKHRKSNISNRRVLGIVKVHAPIAMLYHACNSLLPKPPLTRLFKCLDLICIHLTSLASAKDIMGVRRPSKPPIMFYLSIPFHAVTSALGCFYRDLPCIRFSLIVCNNHPLLHIQKEQAVSRVLLGSACYSSFHISDKYPIGHSIFHALLYPVYDGLFNIIEQEEKHLTWHEQSASPTCDSSNLSPITL